MFCSFIKHILIKKGAFFNFSGGVITRMIMRDEIRLDPRIYIDQVVQEINHLQEMDSLTNKLDL